MVKELSLEERQKKSTTSVHDEIEHLLPKLKTGDVSVESVMSVIAARGKFNPSEIAQIRNTVNEAVTRNNAEEEVKVLKKEAVKKQIEDAKEQKKTAAATPACSHSSGIAPIISVPAIGAPVIMAKQTAEQLICEANVENIKQSLHYEEAVRQLETALAYDQSLEVISPCKAGEDKVGELLLS